VVNLIGAALDALADGIGKLRRVESGEKLVVPGFAVFAALILGEVWLLADIGFATRRKR
jgi:hypothetical protein